MWVVALALALGAGCAPVGTIRPNLPHADGSFSYGATASYSRPLPGREAYIRNLGNVDVGTSALGQVTYRFAHGTELSALGFIGSLNGAGAGLTGRWQLHAVDARRVAVEVGLGAIWAHVALPMAMRVSERLWLTAAPTVAAAAMGPLRLPIGVAWRLQHVTLFAECNVAIDPLRRSYDGRIPTAIAGVIGLERR